MTPLAIEWTWPDTPISIAVILAAGVICHWLLVADVACQNGVPAPAGIVQDIRIADLQLDAVQPCIQADGNPGDCVDFGGSHH